MATDVAETLGNAIGKVAREAAKSIAQSNQKSSTSKVSDRVSGVSDRMKNVPGSTGLAAGAAAATLVPLAAKGASKLVRGIGGNGTSLKEKAGDKVGGKVKDAVGEQVDKAGGATGIAKEGVKGMLPGGGGKKKGMPGVGKGRRMPIQQDIDIGVPLSTVYNEWTQFEEWPNFMHRLQSVSQEDDCHVSFKTKIWGFSREFKAEITEQRPDERIKWQVTEGVTHTGVVTFHELGPRLTRVELNIDVQPGSLIEKAARGMRHVKRAVRADLARFKAYVLMQEEEDGAWRGRIEDGKVKSRSDSGGSSSSSQSGSRSRSASKKSRSRSSSSNGRSSSSRTRASKSRSSSSGGSSARKSSSSGARKTSARKSSSSSGGPSARKSSSSPRKSTARKSGSSSNGSSRTTASSNGRSSSGSNGRSRSSARKRSGARS
jgi:uncharacterized membrane protein